MADLSPNSTKAASYDLLLLDHNGNQHTQMFLRDEMNNVFSVNKDAICIDNFRVRAALETLTNPILRMTEGKLDFLKYQVHAMPWNGIKDKSNYRSQFGIFFLINWNVNAPVGTQERVLDRFSGGLNVYGWYDLVWKSVMEETWKAYLSWLDSMRNTVFANIPTYSTWVAQIKTNCGHVCNMNIRNSITSGVKPKESVPIILDDKSKETLNNITDKSKETIDNNNNKPIKPIKKIYISEALDGEVKPVSTYTVPIDTVIDDENDEEVDPYRLFNYGMHYSHQP